MSEDGGSSSQPFVVVVVVKSLACVLGVIAKNPSPSPRSQRFIPVSSCTSFIVLAFTFKPLIHLE